MTRAPITFIPQSGPGERGRVGSGRLVNGLGETIDDGRKLLKRAPGLKRATASIKGRVHTRGMIPINDNEMFVVYDGGFEKVSYFSGSLSTITDCGFFAGTKPVTLARNNASTPQIICVSELAAFVMTSVGAAPYPDTNVGAPNSVCFIDGYFFFTYGDGSCIASKLNSTDIDLADSVKAESHSDGLMRGVPYRGNLYLFGPVSTEVWQNVGNELAFPFDRVGVIERGLLAPFAIAGWEEGFTHNLIWVGPDRIVYMLNGYSPTRISSFDVEQAIDTLPDKSTMRAFAYVSAGHAIWCLKSDSWTWCYDLLTSTWHERVSLGSDVWRAEGGAYINGGWLLGDETTGALFEPKDGYFFDDDQEIEFIAESAEAKNFPDRATVNRVDFDFVAGQGQAEGANVTITDPKAMISWSNDGGASWTMPIERTIGKQGKYRHGVTALRTGRCGRYGRRWRVSITDPIYIGLLGGTMEVGDEG
jgi:hypothetical protein